MTPPVDPALSAIVLGFILGLQHATDPDHLVAVATIVTRERRFTDGALVGVLWGAGHMTTLTIVGAIIIGLKLTITPAVGSGLELVVAGMLILLGVLRLRDASALPGWVPLAVCRRMLPPAESVSFRVPAAEGAGTGEPRPRVRRRAAGGVRKGRR